MKLVVVEIRDSSEETTLLACEHLLPKRECAAAK